MLNWKQPCCVYCIVLVLILYSCGSDKQPSDILPVANTKPLALDDLHADAFEYIPLETNENILLSGIDKLLSDSLYYYILDTKSQYGLYVFNKKGAFIRTVSSRGNGPGEFVNIYDFDIDDNGNTYLLDADKKRILKFDSRGVFNDEFEYDFRAANFAYVGANNFLFFQKGRYQLNQEDKYDLIVWNSKSGKKTGYIPYSKRSVPLGRFSSLYRSNNNVFYCNYFEDKIYEIVNDKPIVKYNLELGEFFPEDDLFADGKDGKAGAMEVKKAIDEIRCNHSHGLSDCYETNELMVFGIRMGKQFLLCQLWKAKNEFVTYDLGFRRNVTEVKYHFSPSRIIGVDDNYFLTYSMPYTFSNLKKSKRKGELKIKDEKLNDIIDELDSKDNPVIIKYKFDNEYKN